MKLLSGRFALGQLFVEQKRFAEAKNCLQTALARAARRADILPSAYLSLAKVAKELNDEATLKYAVSGAISAEARRKAEAAVGYQPAVLKPGPFAPAFYSLGVEKWYGKWTSKD